MLGSIFADPFQFLGQMQEKTNANAANWESKKVGWGGGRGGVGVGLHTVGIREEENRRSKSTPVFPGYCAHDQWLLKDSSSAATGAN